MDEELARPVSPPVRLSTGKGILDEDSTLLNALIESDQLGPVFKETFGSDKAQEAKMVGTSALEVLFRADTG
jgi:exocyst complex component 6